MKSTDGYLHLKIVVILSQSLHLEFHTIPNKETILLYTKCIKTWQEQQILLFLKTMELVGIIRVSLLTLNQFVPTNT